MSYLLKRGGICYLSQQLTMQYIDAEMLSKISRFDIEKRNEANSNQNDGYVCFAESN